MQYTATYSPEDNKLRLYSVSRLDSETFARVKAAGFRWAPAQKLFVAPMWTPTRADLLIELCGEIGDEDQSLVERAEERADRFEDYSEKRAQDADRAREGVSRIADNIPLGQPILVGHHSERHARKDAQRIENGIRKAVQMWDTSKYWISRAKGAVAAAKYKERPEVRARRIKGLETDKRREQKRIEEAEKFLALWLSPDKELTRERAKALANFDYLSRCYPLAEYPRPEGARVYGGPISLWSALGGHDDPEIITPQQARFFATESHQAQIASSERWIAHISSRLEYEKAMLGEQGASGLLEKKPRPAQLPLCNYRAKTMIYPNPWSRGEFTTVSQVEMTSAEYAKIHNDYKGTREVEHSHRIRTAFVWDKDRNRSLFAIFLTDSKVHQKPAAVVPEPRVPRALPEAQTYRRPEPSEKDLQFAALKEQAKAGVQVTTAPQLFPTPEWLAVQVVERAEIREGDRVLEPSAGTGRLLGAMGGRMFAEPGGKPYEKRDQLHAVEINGGLCDRLRREFPLTEVHHADFLSCNGELGTFDRIVMNPPFTMGADIEHVEKALSYLRDDGRLVAIMGGNTGRRKFVELVSWLERDGATIEIETLPPDSFKDAGTSVNTVLVTIQK